MHFKSIVLWTVLVYCISPLALKGQTTDPLELLKAAEEGQTAQVIQLLNKGIPVNVSNDMGVTALMLAAQNGYFITVKALILNGADVNRSDTEGVTALHLATHTGQLDIAEYLVASGARINVRDQNGLSPFFYAAAYGDQVMTEMYLFHGANRNLTDKEGRTPFLAAVWGGHIEVADMLVKTGSDIQVKDRKGNNALMLAVENNDLLMADSLITWGINPNATNKKGFNALDLAREAGYTELIQYLELIGISPHKVPFFTSVSAGLLFSGNTDDQWGGMRLSLTENRLRMNIHLTYYQRLVRIPVLHEISPELAYQFYESRSALGGGLMKEFKIITMPDNRHLIIFFGTDALLSFGGYKGSSLNPGLTFLLVPETGLLFDTQKWQIIAGYQYLTPGHDAVSPHRLMLQTNLKLW
ncbi:MAG: ankyrin repeat domain-containing protein [Bacteroidales bacterium]|nr:ankyrin repeat domain-containing protein [Bacteroidales bacterium]